MTQANRLTRARASLDRAAILYVIDAIHTEGDVLRAAVDAAKQAGVSVDWLAARIAIFRKGRERPVIVAALKAAGLLPAATSEYSIGQRIMRHRAPGTVVDRGSNSRDAYIVQMDDAEPGAVIMVSAHQIQAAP